MNDLYTLPASPPISGLRFRPLAGVADADALLSGRLGCAAHDGVDPQSTTESLPTREQIVESLRAMPEPAREERTILAEIDGRAVGYNRIFDWPERDGTHVWLTVGWVLPEWRGRGLGTALLHWTESRIHELAAARPGRWEFAANAGGTEIEATTLLRDNGYTPGYTVLEMGLDWEDFASPAVALPASIEVRPVGPEHATLIAASVDESYSHEYAGGRYSEAFDPAAYAVELTGEDYDPSLWQVAWAGEEVVGQVIPRIAKGRAEIYEVSVRPAWRRRGIARTLLSLALLELQAREVDVVRLHTVAEFRTRAPDLYRSLGFRVLKEFPRYRKPA